MNMRCVHCCTYLPTLAYACLVRHVRVSHALVFLVRLSATTSCVYVFRTTSSVPLYFAYIAEYYFCTGFHTRTKITMKKFIAIALLLVAALNRIEPAISSSSNLDDDVPMEKAKKPKLKPPTQLPEVTHRVYLDVGEFS